MRRRFYNRAVAEATPIAHKAVQRIARLYGIEKDIYARPVIAEPEPWLRAKLALTEKKSKLAEAIRYALARWKGLCRFLCADRIKIDPNTVEPSIRPLALNRRNALLAGSDGGGDNRAVIATRIES